MKKSPLQVLEEIDKKRYYPIYFLYGEESYYIDQVTEKIIEKVLSEEEKAFNQHIFYGKDSTVAVIADTARRFPMMAEYQLVVVKEAQQLQDIDLLSPYIETPQPTTILVLCYKHKNPDKRKKIFQLLDKKAVTVESAKIKEHRLPAWIMEYCQEKGIAVDIQTATLLAEFLGSDLAKIEKEIEKLLLILPKDKKKISPDLIENYIGFSKEFNHFELTNALSSRDIPKATQIILHFCKNQQTYPIQVTLGYLYFYFNKLLLYHAVKSLPREEIAKKLKIHPFFIGEYQKAAGYYSQPRLEKVFEVLRDVDLKSKGIGNLSSSSCDLLKEMIYKIMHL